MASWTFITNHAVVLTYLVKHPSITAQQLALEIGITERAIRGIIADLAAGGYIVKTKEGRRVRYRVKADLPMRHGTQRSNQVGKLLKILLGETGTPARKQSSLKP
jgi:predicted ArsR family transcriptional regulator